MRIFKQHLGKIRTKQRNNYNLQNKKHSKAQCLRRLAREKLADSRQSLRHSKIQKIRLQSKRRRSL